MSWLTSALASRMQPTVRTASRGWHKKSGLCGSQELRSIEGSGAFARRRAVCESASGCGWARAFALYCVAKQPGLRVVALLCNCGTALPSPWLRLGSVDVPFAAPANIRDASECEGLHPRSPGQLRAHTPRRCGDVSARSGAQGNPRPLPLSGALFSKITMRLGVRTDFRTI